MDHHPVVAGQYPDDMTAGRVETVVVIARIMELTHLRTAAIRVRRNGSLAIHSVLETIWRSPGPHRL
jgi:hypothetical protein